MVEYDELVLNLFATCPLRTESPDPDRHLATASDVLQWALLREFEGDRPSLAGLREKYVAVWKSLYYSEYKDSSVPENHPTYWEGPRKARSMAKQILDLLRVYEVVHPVEPYTLILGKSSVKGSYAVVRKRVPYAIPRVLVIRSQTFPSFREFPDMLSIARWLDARRQSTAREIGILFLPLGLSYKAWSLDQVDERLAQQWVGSILESIPKTRYANPGVHCVTCVRKDCLEVYRG